MLSNYFSMPWHLAQMRSSCVGPYLDGFIKTLVARGYSALGVRKFVRPVAHFGRWADRAGADVASWDQKTLRRFKAHLRRCRCEPNRGVFELAIEHVATFFDYLRAEGAIPAAAPIASTPRFLGLSEEFADWMRRNRGVAEGTPPRGGASGGWGGAAGKYRRAELQAGGVGQQANTAIMMPTIPHY